MSRNRFESAAYPLGRMLVLGWASAKFGWRFLIWRHFSKRSGPRALRDYIQECGGLFPKVGQLMAVRLDVIPKEYEEELRELLSQSNYERIGPQEFSYVKEVVEEELGRPLEEVFEKFPEKPAAWASVAQVHRATLRECGTEVAVKVMRAGVKQALTTDLLFLRVAASTLDSLGLFRSYGLRQFVDELCRITQRELSFVTEATYIEELRSRMLDDQVGHYAPKVYSELSKERVMVLEWLQGVWVSDMLETVDAARDGDELAQTLLDKWATSGITPQQTARLIFRSLIEQSCRYRVFHADPHPGNLIVGTGGVLQYVDFGLVGYLDEFAWEKLQKLFKHMAFHNTHGTYESLIGTVEPLPPINTKGLESEIKMAVADWLTASKGRSGRMEEKSNGRLLMRAVDAMRRNRIQFPWAIMALFRATIVSDITVYRLDPEFDATEELRDFFESERTRRLRKMFSFPVWQKTAYAMIESAGTMSETIDEVSSWTRTRLPRVGRSYGQSITRLESGISLGLGYARSLLLLVGLAILLGGLVSGTAPFASSLGSMAFFAGVYWLPAGILSLLSGILAGRIARRMEQPL